MEKIRYYYYKLFNRKKYKILFNKQKEKKEDIRLSDRILNNYFRKCNESNYREFESKKEIIKKNENSNLNYKNMRYLVKNDNCEEFSKFCVLETELAENLFLPEIIDIKLNKYTFEILNNDKTICSWKYNQIYKIGIIEKFIFINFGKIYLNSGYLYFFSYNNVLSSKLFKNLNKLLKCNIVKYY